MNPHFYVLSSWQHPWVVENRVYGPMSSQILNFVLHIFWKLGTEGSGMKCDSYGGHVVQLGVMIWWAKKKKRVSAHIPLGPLYCENVNFGYALDSTFFFSLSHLNFLFYGLWTLVWQYASIWHHVMVVEWWRGDLFMWIKENK